MKSSVNGERAKNRDADERLAPADVVLRHRLEERDPEDPSQKGDDGEGGGPRRGWAGTVGRGDGRAGTEAKLWSLNW